MIVIQNAERDYKCSSCETSFITDIHTVGPNGHFRDIGQSSKIYKKSIEWAYEYCQVMGSKVWAYFCPQTMRKTLNHGLSGPWLIKI